MLVSEENNNFYLKNFDLKYDEKTKKLVSVNNKEKIEIIPMKFDEKKLTIIERLGLVRKIRNEVKITKESILKLINHQDLRCVICKGFKESDNLLSKCQHSLCRDCIGSYKTKKKMECPICKIKGLREIKENHLYKKISIILLLKKSLVLRLITKQSAI
jgi:hypothetical protein